MKKSDLRIGMTFRSMCDIGASRTFNVKGNLFVITDITNMLVGFRQIEDTHVHIMSRRDFVDWFAHITGYVKLI